MTGARPSEPPASTCWPWRTTALRPNASATRRKRGQQQALTGFEVHCPPLRTTGPSSRCAVRGAPPASGSLPLTTVGLTALTTRPLAGGPVSARPRATPEASWRQEKPPNVPALRAGADLTEGAPSGMTVGDMSSSSNYRATSSDSFGAPDNPGCAEVGITWGSIIGWCPPVGTLGIVTWRAGRVTRRWSRPVPVFGS